MGSDSRAGAQAEPGSSLRAGGASPSTASPRYGCAAFDELLGRWKERIQRELDIRLAPEHQEPARLHAALRYSTLGPGKRVRPCLVYGTAMNLGVDESLVDGAACAVEMIHAYSLVHDDLPAMDDDDLRRGRPTCHKAFDEATAILVGDALQVLAFEMLASGPGLPDDPAVRLKLVNLLAVGSGARGMAGGQALDLGAVGRSLTLAEVEEMHNRKTGALIHASVMMAAACAPELASAKERALDAYAHGIGLAFQIQDDLLDIEGDPAILGKATGADQAHRKPTYPAVAGVEAARARVHELHTQALRALATAQLDQGPLEALSDWLLLRSR